jgi:diguanylate cyclase (GGDEF)-like protein
MLLLIFVGGAFATGPGASSEPSTASANCTSASTVAKVESGEPESHFYRNGSIGFACTVVAAFLLVLIRKITVRQLESREARLMRLVTERTRELAEANEALQALANSDGLTKIGNRRRFESFLSDEWHRAVRFKTHISLVLFDIDHFKLYNDTYGHQAGDACLQKVAEAFAATIKRPTDIVARFGGEEFAMVLGGTDAAGARQIAEQAVANVRKLSIRHCESLTSEFLTVSVGIATVLASFELTETDLVKLADAALYRAKHSGRDRIVTNDHVQHGPLNADLFARTVLLPTAGVSPGAYFENGSRSSR